jgi:hypothetical protein
VLSSPLIVADSEIFVSTRWQKLFLLFSIIFLSWKVKICKYYIYFKNYFPKGKRIGATALVYNVAYFFFFYLQDVSAFVERAGIWIGITGGKMEC